MDPQTLTTKLIKKGNVDDPGDTREIANFIKSYLADHGIKAKQYGNGKHRSVLAHKNKEASGPTLMLCGHMDVVAVNKDGWDKQPYSPCVDNGWLFGRGSMDMKAGLAGLLLAFMRANPDYPLSFLAVADEEQGGDHGAGFLLNNDIISPDACLIGEPTKPGTMNIGSKGRVEFEIKANGQNGHASTNPYLGSNAIESLSETLPVLVPRLRLTQLDRTDWDKDVLRATVNKNPFESKLNDDQFESMMKSVTTSVGTIRGGSQANIIPGQAKAIVDLRYPPGLNINDITALLDKRISGQKNVEYSIKQHKPPVLVDTDHPIVQSIKKATDAEAVYNFASGDTAHFAQHGVPALTYGPVNGKRLHGPDECVRISDLQKLPTLYKQVIKQYGMN